MNPICFTNCHLRLLNELLRWLTIPNDNEFSKNLGNQERKLESCPGVKMYKPEVSCAIHSFGTASSAHSWKAPLSRADLQVKCPHLLLRPLRELLWVWGVLYFVLRAVCREVVLSPCTIASIVSWNLFSVVSGLLQTKQNKNKSQKKSFVEMRLKRKSGRKKAPPTYIFLPAP